MRAMENRALSWVLTKMKKAWGCDQSKYESVRNQAQRSGLTERTM